MDVPGKVASVEYDRTVRPNRTDSFCGRRETIYPAPLGLKVGDTVVTSENADIKPGNCMTLLSIPLGTWVHNVELSNGRGGQLCRSAGSYAQVMAKEGGYVLLRLPSGELRQVWGKNRGTIGQVGNTDHENTVHGKAGRTRWLGRRPTVRTARNPLITHMVVVKVAPRGDILSLHGVNRPRDTVHVILVKI